MKRRRLSSSLTAAGLVLLIHAAASAGGRPPPVLTRKLAELGGADQGQIACVTDTALAGVFPGHCF